MPLDPGTRLGPYEIAGPLGRGGMGDVYRARDTRLDREIAIKVLPDSLARDPERLARFEREARVLASLNHPNIATIYGLEESAEGKAIAMELVDGATLQPPLPLDTVLDYACQIAEALEAAHDKAVTHRDLKPANIMVTPAGVVKVLDFGLAAVARTVSTNGADSPTFTMGMTEAGMIMGTAGYMAPEQAVGHPVDRRADIWAFGVVLWEMVAGKPLFTGDTTAHILADVIRADIDFSRLPDTTPSPIRELLKRCLDRDVKSRLQWIGEARVAIRKYLSGDRLDVETPRTIKSGRALWGWAVAGVLAVALVATFILLKPREQPSLLRTSLMLPESLGIVPAAGLAISPDGKHVAFVGIQQGKQQVWIRDFDSAAANPLPGTDSAYRIFWSPDSRSVGFCADNKLKRIDIAGGRAISLADFSICGGGTWSRDGVIVAALGDRGLVRVPAGGGRPVQVIAPPERGFRRSPYFLPDGRHLLYTESRGRGLSPSLSVSDLEGKTYKQLLPTDSNAVYVEPGYLLYVDDSTLMAQPFDARKLELSGDAVPVAEGVAYASGPMGGDFSVSSNGMLAYNADTGVNLTLKWFDRSGKVSGTIGSAGRLRYPAISPGGDRIAFERAERQGTDVWIYDIERGTESRLTSEPGNESHPVWSPDGSYLVFMKTRPPGPEHLYRLPSKGIAPVEDLGAEGFMAKDWSRDGRYILGDTASRGKTLNDLLALPLFGDKKSFSFIQSEFVDMHPKFSPGGDWVAYMSNRTGRTGAEVYLASFPEPKRGNKVSVSGGDYPIWSRDGKEIYYMGVDGTIWAAEVRGSGSALTTAAPKQLFRAPGITQPRGFDVAKDGRFLIPVAEEESKASSITLIQNWTSLLRRQ